MSETTRSSRSTKADEPPVDPEAAAEAEKAKRADAGVTGDPSGNPAGVAFSDRIADAKFALRNQGHSLIEGLLDDMLAALQRLEAKLFGG